MDASWGLGTLGRRSMASQIARPISTGSFNLGQSDWRSSQEDSTKHWCTQLRIRVAWRSLDADFVCRGCRSVPCRLIAVIEAQGGLIEKWPCKRLCVCVFYHSYYWHQALFSSITAPRTLAHFPPNWSIIVGTPVLSWGLDVVIALLSRSGVLSFQN